MRLVRGSSRFAKYTSGVSYKYFDRFEIDSIIRISTIMGKYGRSASRI